MEEEGTGGLPTEAEGFELHMSDRSGTGYRGVCKNREGGRFVANTMVKGGHVHIGMFDTAVEAAVAYARNAPTGELQPRPEETEVDGLQLHLNSKSATGYLGVKAAPEGASLRHATSGTSPSSTRRSRRGGVRAPRAVPRRR